MTKESPSCSGTLSFPSSSSSPLAGDFDLEERLNADKSPWSVEDEDEDEDDEEEDDEDDEDCPPSRFLDFGNACARCHSR